MVLTSRGHFIVMYFVILMGVKFQIYIINSLIKLYIKFSVWLHVTQRGKEKDSHNIITCTDPPETIDIQSKNIMCHAPNVQ